MNIENVLMKEEYTEAGWQQLQADAGLISKIVSQLTPEELVHLTDMLDLRFPEAFRMILELSER